MSSSDALRGGLVPDQCASMSWLRPDEADSRSICDLWDGATEEGRRGVRWLRCGDGGCTWSLALTAAYRCCCHMALYGVVALALTVVAAATPGVGPTDAARPLPEPHGVEGSVAMIEFYCLGRPSFA